MEEKEKKISERAEEKRPAEWKKPKAKKSSLVTEMEKAKAKMAEAASVDCFQIDRSQTRILSRLRLCTASRQHTAQPGSSGRSPCEWLIFRAGALFASETAAFDENRLFFWIFLGQKHWTSLKAAGRKKEAERDWLRETEVAIELVLTGCLKEGG